MVRTRRFSMLLRTTLRNALHDENFDWRRCAEVGASVGGATGHRVSVEIPREDLAALDRRLASEAGSAPRQHALRGLVLRVLDERPWE